MKIEDTKKLIRRVDKLLYKDKKRRKNKLCFS